MTVQVLKFGGTSLRTLESRRQAVGHVQDALAASSRVVVVVSAMGRHGDPYATDTLLQQIGGGSEVHDRDRDLLMACGETISAVVFAHQLSLQGISAKPMTGGQAGIETDASHGRARIVRIHPEAITDCWDQGLVPVVAGFQGGAHGREVTTLGRGGSDTSAAALGVALKADAVDIFTDVDGVMTADPRLVPEARPIPALRYQDMYQLASLGAKVVHPRAVEMAMPENIPIRVRKTGSTHPGTVIGRAVGELEEDRLMPRVIGVTQREQVCRFTIKDTGRSLAEVFGGLARPGLEMDWIVSGDGFVSLVASGPHAETAIQLLDANQMSVEVEEGFSSVAVVGRGADQTGVLAQAVDALEQQSIEIIQSGHLAQGLGVLVEEARMGEAVRTLHRAFALGDRATTKTLMS